MLLGLWIENRNVLNGVARKLVGRRIHAKD
jgi:hypothetical protein